jgi:NTE family protein
MIRARGRNQLVSISPFRHHRIRRLLWKIRRPVLALGGGGARGFAHLGVLEVLEEERLPIRGIAGTSMGALVGATFLAHESASRAIAKCRRAIDEEIIPPVRPLRNKLQQSPQEHPLFQAARRIRNNIVVAFAFNRTTVLEDSDLVRAVEFLIPDIGVEDLALPFVAVATDLEDGTEAWLATGDLRRALRASSSIPGLLPAVRMDGRTLADGGVVAEVPVRAARTLGWPVVAVDVSMDVPPRAEEDLVFDTLTRTQLISLKLLRREQLRHAADVIRPEVGHATWADWVRFEELVEAGRSATRRFLGLE